MAGSVALVRSRIARVVGFRGGRWPANVSLADAEQEGMLAVWCALRAWDGCRPLTTLAVICIDRQLRRWRAQTFPVLHVSRAKYAAAKGRFPAPASLDQAWAEGGPTLGERTADGSVWSCDPLLLLEMKERVAEEAARRAICPGAAGHQRRTTPVALPSYRIIALRRWDSGWYALGWAFATPLSVAPPTRPAGRRAPSADAPACCAPRVRALPLDLVA